MQRLDYCRNSSFLNCWFAAGNWTGSGVRKLPHATLQIKDSCILVGVCSKCKKKAALGESSSLYWTFDLGFAKSVNLPPPLIKKKWNLNSVGDSHHNRIPSFHSLHFSFYVVAPEVVLLMDKIILL